ncbi:MAG: hypothetical protein WC279_12580 [Sulfurimonas sp.]|jgi:hypothetical protein|uniref:hypothetical protein n=1 Tax=Sulfurimonas sp. TaxID=2022749 RepID=UPI003565D6B4
MRKDNERERLVEVIGDYEIIETHCYPSSYCVRYKGQVDNNTCNFARTAEECREKIAWRIKSRMFTPDMIKRSFPEHEQDDPGNGCYSHHCKRCGKEFLAHKHYYNPVCRLCADNQELEYALKLTGGK